MTKGNTQIGYGYIEETKDGIIYHYKNDQYRGKAIYDDKQESLILHLDGLKIYLKQTVTGCLIRYENQMIVIQENQVEQKAECGSRYHNGEKVNDSEKFCSPLDIVYHQGKNQCDPYLAEQCYHYHDKCVLHGNCHIFIGKKLCIILVNRVIPALGGRP